MSTLKSKKMWILILGLCVAVVLAVVCQKVLGLDDDMTTQIIVWVLALIGVAEGGHIAADVVSMTKGLQKKKDK